MSSLAGNCIHHIKHYDGLYSSAEQSVLLIQSKFPTKHLSKRAALLDNFVQWWNFKATHSWETEQIFVKQPLSAWALSVIFCSTHAYM